MVAEDHYLLDLDLEEIMNRPIDSTRGWLCSVLIARGDFDAARMENMTDRSDMRHTLPHLTHRQQQALLDWRRLHLPQDN